MVLAVVIDCVRQAGGGGQVVGSAPLSELGVTRAASILRVNAPSPRSCSARDAQLGILADLPIGIDVHLLGKQIVLQRAQPAVVGHVPRGVQRLKLALKGVVQRRAE